MAENLMEEEVVFNEKAVSIINEDLVAFVETLKDLVSQLEPQVKSISKELSPTINAIRANLDRDETIVLAERLSANTGILLELVGYLEALHDLKQGLEPQLKAITHEFGPRLNAIKVGFDRDETFLLLERLAANTDTFLELIGYLEALNDMRRELEPQLKAIAKETGPILNTIKSNLDRDETLVLVERLTANTGTLLEMVSLLEAFNDLRKELEPQVKAMAKEMSPAITAVRSFLENERTIQLASRTFSSLQRFMDDDEVFDVIDRVPNLKAPMLKLMDCMCATAGGCEEGPTVAETSIDSLLKLTEIASSPLIQGMVAASASAVKEMEGAQIQPMTPMKMMSALRDKDVQRATGFLFHFLKKLGQGLNSPGT